MSESLSDYINRKPTNRKQLASWVKHFLGFTIHSTVRCNHVEHEDEYERGATQQHDSQLDYIAGAFFNEYRNAVFLAARGAGKSQLCAIACFLDLWFKNGIKIAVSAFKREQSDYIYEYLCRLIEHFNDIRAQIGQCKVARISQNVIQFHNESEIRFYSGGSSKGNIQGYHPNVLIVDEADSWTQARFDGIANALDGRGKYPQRFDTLSTNYSMSGEGVVLRQIERCKDFNATKPDHMQAHRVFRICLIDILEKCGDQYECLTCPLHPYCQGRAKNGEGFVTVENALQTMYSGSKPNFESQLLLLRPTSEHSYFYNFDRAKQVSEPEVEWDNAKEGFVCFDFGGSRCPHACLVMQKGADGVYYALDEFQRMGRIEGMIEEVKRAYPSITDARCFFDPAGNKKDNIKDAKSYKKALQQAGFFPRSRQLKRRQTFELIFNLIEPAAGPTRFKVNKRCKHLISQIQAAECELENGKPTREPRDLPPDDLLDCLRYIVGWTQGTYAKNNGVRTIWF